MRQRECLLALKNLIWTNRAALVSGIAHQGVDRELKRIALARAVAPIDFYHMLIEVEATTSLPALARQNVVKVNERNLYVCAIHIMDAAFQQSPDVEANPYEKMTLDFRVVTQRIVTLLREAGGRGGCFQAPAPDDNGKFRLPTGGPERQVIVRNDDDSWIDTGDMLNFMLYTRILFTVEEPWA
jgi:hypothetical protein